MEGSGFPPFHYNHNVTQNAGDFVARIALVRSKEALFDALSRSLQFPEYFGRNWDALDEFLGDLSWIASSRVVLLHDWLPHLGRKEQTIYLAILARAISDIRADGRELVVGFPEQTRTLFEAWQSVPTPQS